MSTTNDIKNRGGATVRTTESGARHSWTCLGCGEGSERPARTRRGNAASAQKHARSCFRPEVSAEEAEQRFLGSEQWRKELDNAVSGTRFRVY